MAAYVIKDCVKTAECLWALQLVMKKMSFNSCNNISELFKRMFSDSQIAQQFHLGKTKAMHVVAFGLAPYFSDLLLKQMKECQTFVIYFDEALNKVFQKGQMDLVVLFWDDYCHKVFTWYLTSVFLQTATDLLQKFQEGMSSLSVAKLLQVSMDGPNVNHLFLRKLKEEIKTDLDCKEEGKELIDFGTCSLHVVHGSFKTGLQAVKWDLNSVLHNMYYLFKDSPARRASYTAMTGSTLFPLKFCSTRWLENVKCLDRAMTVFDNIKKYVKEAKLPHSKPAIRIEAAMQDPFMKCKMAFMKTVAGDFEPFLQRFQNQKPLAPFLYEELCKLIKKLMRRSIKSEMLQNVSSGSQLLTIDMKLSENLLDRSKIDIGFAAKKLLKETKLSERQVAEFCLGCRNMVVAIVEKLIERSPLKFKMVRGLSALDPTIISYKPNLGITRIGAVLEALHAANQNNDTVAEKSKQQYTTLTTAVHNEFKAQFQAYVAKQNYEVGLDTFYSGILMSNKSFSDLWTVVKMCLILFHGNTSVESGFSVNKSVLIENLHEETVVCQCQVYDAVLNCGGLESVVIDRNLL